MEKKEVLLLLIYYLIVIIFFFKGGTSNINSLIIFSLFLIFPIIFLKAREHSKIERYEKEFPEFLRDLAYYIEIGFPLPKAIRELSKTYKGDLKKEIKKMVYQMSLGFPFTYVLKKFSERIRSSLIKKTVLTLEEIEKAGGNISSSLLSLSTTLQDINNLRKEIESKMRIHTAIFYGILLLFVVIALILRNMVRSFIVSYIKSPEIFLQEFDSIILLTIIINSIFTGFSIGKATKGAASRGIIHSFILSLLSYTLYNLIIYLF